MADEFNVYDHKQQLPHGVWVINKGNKEWSDEMNRNMEVLDGLLDHKTLIVKDSEGNTLVEFDGKVDKILTLPENQATVDIKTLTIKNEDGEILATFNGTEDKVVVIANPQEPQEIKALTIKDADGNILAVFDGSEEKEVTVGNSVTNVTNINVDYEDNSALDFIFE